MPQFIVSVQLDRTVEIGTRLECLDALMDRLGFERNTTQSGLTYCYTGGALQPSAKALFDQIEVNLEALDPFAKVIVRGRGQLWTNTPP